MRDMHDGSFSPDCVDCLKYEKSQLEAELREQKALTEEVHTKLDALSGQLDTALTDRTVERDRVASLHRANSDLRAENARRRNENKGLQVELEKARAEVESLRWEARVRTTPTMNRVHALEEENARLEADNARLEELVGKLDKAVAKRDERISYAEDALAAARKERDEVCDYRVVDLQAYIDVLTKANARHVGLANKARADLKKVSDYL